MGRWGAGGGGAGKWGGGKKTVSDTHQRWRLICFRVGTDALQGWVRTLSTVGTDTLQVRD